jgi:hypothetical protein
MSLPDVAHFLGTLIHGKSAIEGEPSRRELLLSTGTGSIHFPLLVARNAEIEALPAPLTKRRPVQSELSDKDARHDAFAEAIIAMTEGYRALALWFPELAAVAERIQLALVPTRSVKIRSYVATRQQAPTLRESLAALEPDLRRLPVASEEGEVQTLYEWAEAYVAAAEGLGDLVDLRWALEAKVQPTDRKAAVTVRATAITAITRCRETLAAELEARPELPRNLDALIFGPFDDLATEAEPTGRKAPALADPPESPEVPEPA